VSLFPLSGTITHGSSSGSHQTLLSNPNCEGPQDVKIRKKKEKNYKIVEDEMSGKTMDLKKKYSLI
jgi:hypothetical protein